MSLTNTKKEKIGSVSAFLFAAAGLVFHIFCVAFAAALKGADNPFVMTIVGLLPCFASVLFYSMSALASGRNRTIVMLVPLALSCVYLRDSMQGFVTALLAAATPIIGASMIYSLYKRGTGKSTLCSVTAFSMLAFELVRSLVDTAFLSGELGRKFGTVLFDRLGGIVDGSIEIIKGAFETASKMYPGLESALTGSEIQILKSSLALSLSLTPAILFTVFFAFVFIAVSIVDFYNKHKGFLPDSCYGLYSVPHSVYIVFNIVTVIYILNLFFGSGLSGFFTGIVSALLFLLPHFLILAYRRLFYLLSKACGDFFAIVILVVVSAAGLFLSAQIMLWVLAFFGSSEHRAQEFANMTNDSDDE